MSGNAIVQLREGVTRIGAQKAQCDIAVSVAMRVTMSVHEWEWTDAEQEAMARYVHWAAQRLAAIRDIAAGLDL